VQQPKEFAAADATFRLYTIDCCIWTLPEVQREVRAVRPSPARNKRRDGFHLTRENSDTPTRKTPTVDRELVPDFITGTNATFGAK